MSLVNAMAAVVFPVPGGPGPTPGGELRANVKNVKNENNGKNTTTRFDLGFGLSAPKLARKNGSEAILDNFS